MATPTPQTRPVHICEQYLLEIERLRRIPGVFNPELNNTQALVNHALSLGLRLLREEQEQLDEQLNKHVTSDKVIKGVLKDIEVTE